MESFPQRIQIKRKRDQPAPDSLYLQPENEGYSPKFTKRILTENAFMFKRVILEATSNGRFNSQPSEQLEQDQNGTLHQRTPSKSRRFHLTRPQQVTNPSSQVGVSKKRRRDDGDIATFIERSPPPPVLTILQSAPAQKVEAVAEDKTKLKRPNTRAMKPSPTPSRPSTPPKQICDNTMSTLLEMVNEAAIENTSPPPSRRPQTLKYKPVVPQQRRQREEYTPTPIAIPTLANPEPHKNLAKNIDSMDLDEDYVVETYIRHPIKQSDPLPRDIGFLIIGQTEEDVWESYMHDLESSEEEWDTDDEDENAEDWHGADYPDESDSDREDEGSDMEEYLFEASDDENGKADWREAWK